MEECRRLALQGYPEGTVVFANSQKAGRGRFSRSWISPRGENLQISILIPAALISVRLLSQAGHFMSQ